MAVLTAPQVKNSAAWNQLHVTDAEEHILRTGIYDGTLTIHDWITILLTIREH